MRGRRYYIPGGGILVGSLTLAMVREVIVIVVVEGIGPAAGHGCASIRHKAGDGPSTVWGTGRFDPALVQQKAFRNVVYRQAAHECKKRQEMPAASGRRRVVAGQVTGCRRR